jgi:hypothetical protein
MAVSFLLAARSRFSVFSVGDYRPAAPQKWGTHISLILGAVNLGLRGLFLVLMLVLVIVIESGPGGSITSRSTSTITK